jgi:hypothetical protein
MAVDKRHHTCEALTDTHTHTHTPARPLLRHTDTLSHTLHTHTHTCEALAETH